MMTGREIRDIGSLGIVDGATFGLSLDHFRGAVHAAEQLGYRVDVRGIRSPTDGLHAIIAAAYPPPEEEAPVTLEPPRATPRLECDECQRISYDLRDLGLMHDCERRGSFRLTSSANPCMWQGGSPVRMCAFERDHVGHCSFEIT
jgi:hypothetical protein